MQFVINMTRGIGFACGYQPFPALSLSNFVALRTHKRGTLCISASMRQVETKSTPTLQLGRNGCRADAAKVWQDGAQSSSKRRRAERGKNMTRRRFAPPTFPASAPTEGKGVNGVEASVRVVRR
jgi:hypothetical protein